MCEGILADCNAGRKEKRGAVGEMPDGKSPRAFASLSPPSALRPILGAHNVAVSLVSVKLETSAAR